MSFDRPGVRKLFDDGVAVVFAQRDEFGHQIILGRLAVADPSHNKNVGRDALTLATLIFDTLYDNEENQIRGFTYIMDVSNIRLRHFFIYSIMTWLKYGKNAEVNLSSVHF
jgi:hypothetical protein